MHIIHIPADLVRLPFDGINMEFVGKVFPSLGVGSARMDIVGPGATVMDRSADRCGDVHLGYTSHAFAESSAHAGAGTAGATSSTAGGCGVDRAHDQWCVARKRDIR